MTFTKKPLKTKTKPNMKNYIIALIATLIIVGGVMYHRTEVTALEEAKNKLIDQVNTPTELESLTEELELNRVSRIERQKIIDAQVEAKKLEAKRADEINKRIIELTGVAFQ